MTITRENCWSVRQCFERADQLSDEAEGSDDALVRRQRLTRLASQQSKTSRMLLLFCKIRRPNIMTQPMYTSLIGTLKWLSKS